MNVRWFYAIGISISLLGAGCLEESGVSEAENTFDSSKAYQSCDDCHLAMPPSGAPHDETHAFFACNNKGCHGGLVSEDGTEALKTDSRHTNGKMDASCLKCHEEDEVEDVPRGESTLTCAACHTLPHLDVFEDVPHEQFACNDPNCHGAMVSSKGDKILDESKHQDEKSEASCDSCHGQSASCDTCHQTPPASSPHNDGYHDMYQCDNDSCHGDMVNSDGTAILDESRHMDGQSEIQDLSCGAFDGCHGA